jgi:hypothetical protein
VVLKGGLLRIIAPWGGAKLEERGDYIVSLLQNIVMLVVVG